MGGLHGAGCVAAHTVRAWRTPEHVFAYNGSGRVAAPGSGRRTGANTCSIKKVPHRGTCKIRLAAEKSPPPRAGQINSSIILGGHMGGRKPNFKSPFVQSSIRFQLSIGVFLSFMAQGQKGAIAPLLTPHKYSHNVSHTFRRISPLLYMYLLPLYYLDIQLNISYYYTPIHLFLRSEVLNLCL